MRQRASGTASTRVGIVGCGVIAVNHLRALQHVKNVDLVAVCDRNAEIASSLAHRHRVPSVHTDLATMLSEERLDVLHVTTPPRTHEAICGLALENGCDVLVEKPAALSLAELDHMMIIGRANDATLSVVHNGLFQEAFGRAVAAVREGAIGEIRSVHITDVCPWDHETVAKGDHWSHALPGGVFGEMLPHDVYLADALVQNLHVDDVRTRGPGQWPWLPVDRVHATLSSDFALVTIHAAVDSRAWNKTIDITGTAGAVRIDRMCDIVTFLHAAAFWTRRPHIDRVLSHVGGWMQQTAGIAAARLEGRPASGDDTLIRSFYSALSEGALPPVSEDSMRQTTALYEELMKAIDNDVISSR